MSAGHSRKQYVTIFIWLAVLTGFEVGLVYLHGISKAQLVVALIGVAIAKASMVGLYFMHLKSETRALKLTVAIPMMTPAVYAVVLIAEAAWRHLP